jgi:hypothetical protein
MSRLSGRLGRSMSRVAVGVVTVALLGALGTSLAFAAPASATASSQGSGYRHPKPHITCDPRDPHIFGGCQIEFKDVSDPNGNQGLNVCFSTTGKNIVIGEHKNCSRETARGRAYGVFIALQCGPATITGVEKSKVNGKFRVRTASVNIDVRCGRHKVDTAAAATT